MSFTLAADGVIHPAGPSTFHTYVSPSLGSTELCAWRYELAADTQGQPHRPTHEEVFLGLTGQLLMTVDGATSAVGVGDVVRVPAGAELRVDSGAKGGSAWVSTTAGLEAFLTDGTRISPPWAA